MIHVTYYTVEPGLPRRPRQTRGNGSATYPGYLCLLPTKERFLTSYATMRSTMIHHRSVLGSVETFLYEDESFSEPQLTAEFRQPAPLACPNSGYLPRFYWHEHVHANLDWWTYFLQPQSYLDVVVN